MLDDLATIAAIATAPGAGGIGIIRLSGAQSKPLLKALFHPTSPRFVDFTPWMLHHGRLIDAKGRTLDDVLAVFMPGSATFTGEDVVELHCHGGPALLAVVMDELLLRGARMAERGEFSRRAFLNGRMDLSQAEAVAELIAAPSAEGARLAAGKLGGLLGQRVEALREKLEYVRARLCLAVDFPEDEIEGASGDLLAPLYEADAAVTTLLAGVERTRCWREGIVVALAGPVNAGKSSLMNALLGRERAIVTALPGTTRDFLEESVMLAGLPARLVDTAGLREAAPDDPIEAEGIRLGQERVSTADVVVVLVDGLSGMTKDSFTMVQRLDPAKTVLVWNKLDVVTPERTDKASLQRWQSAPCCERVEISARTGEGIEHLASVLRRVALAGLSADEPNMDDVAPNARQARELIAAHEELTALINDMAAGVPYELCAVRLEGAVRALDSVVGFGTADDVLNRIFDTFCIGK